MVSWKPLVIIGAPRSGTNMLRDVICRLDGYETWPCDEINYIWRHGNYRWPSDRIPPKRATREVRQYIRSRFESLAHQREARVVVEKTCANSLRVPFVDAVLPNAKYLYIVRDGLDVVSSASERWKAKMDFSYILKKARYVPVTDVPYYATRFLANRLFQFTSKDKRLAFWGPRLDGMVQLLAQYSIEEVCALQWGACVSEADQALRVLGPNRVYRVRYETFVSNPRDEMKMIGDFLQISDFDLAKLDINGINTNSIGRGRRKLAKETANQVISLLSETLDRHGYKCD